MRRINNYRSPKQAAKAERQRLRMIALWADPSKREARCAALRIINAQESHIEKMRAALILHWEGVENKEPRITGLRAFNAERHKNSKKKVKQPKKKVKQPEKLSDLAVLLAEWPRRRTK